MRLAAALRLSGRTAVTTEQVAADADTAPASDVAGGRECDHTLAGSSTFEVTSEAVAETVGTGLFTSYGDGRYGFVHASFAEYLAARWLSSAGLHPDQVENLMTVEAASRRTIAPQLREVGAWLVGMSDEFLDKMIEAEPAIALRGDLEQTTADQRDRLVDALVRGAADETVDLYGWRFQSTAAQLRHSGLVAQLRRVLENSGGAIAARQAACDVAAACELHALIPLLTTVSLNADEPGPVRVHAVRALEKVADDSTLRQLHSLATRELPDDPEDELKGAVLRAVWPRTLPARDVFRALTPPRRRNLLGLYKSFLWGDLVEGLSDQDIPVALRWASTLEVSHDPMNALADTREDILVRAWPHVTTPGVAKPYSRALKRLLSAHHRDLLDRRRRQKHPDVLVGSEGRRALVRELIGAVTDGTLSAVDLRFSTPPLVRPEDFDWLGQRLARTVGRRNENGWASLLALVGMHADRDVDLLNMREESEALRQQTAERFAPVALHSPAADRARQHRALVEEVDRDEAEEREKRADISALVSDALERFSSSDPHQFANAIYLLSFEADQHQFRWYESDIRQLHGWELLSRRQRSDLLDAAPVYLASMRMDHKTWFTHRNVNHAAWAGYRAIRALYEMRPRDLARLEPGLWRAWAPVIVGWPRDSRTGPDFHQWALAQLNVKAPTEASEWFARKLDRDLRGAQIIGLDQFAVIWTPRLEEIVLRRARRSSVSPRARADLVAFLIQHNSAPGRRLARRLVSPAALRARGRRRELALHVARVLAKNAIHSEWSHLWQLMERFPSFGRDLIADLADDRRSSIAPQLTVTDAAKLFELTEKHFPASKDLPLPDGVGNVTRRHQISDWRDDILRVLAANGTPEATETLGVIAHRHPERPGLVYYARQAVESLLASSWNPPAPSDVIRLSADIARRWVRSDRELRDVIVASLERAQLELQGHTPAVEVLWNTRPVTPKPENALSNWLKGFLQHDLRGRGILVGRETEIRPGPGSRMGESVDLEINAVAGERVEGARLVSVIVEVKGCWNPKIGTAMETQLADRYLGPTARQGIYLVGWYAAANWSTKDRRRAPCARRAPQDWEELLDQQAGSLSSSRDVEITPVVLDCSAPWAPGHTRVRAEP